MNEARSKSPAWLPRFAAIRSGSSSAAVPIMLSGIVLVGILYGGYTWWRIEKFKAEKEAAIPADTIGPPLKVFELTERSGEPFRSEDMRGRVWVVSYFFTTCPGQCLRLNSNIQIMSKQADLKDVVWVSITCDPDNDTLEALRAYAERWEADPKNWLFCRGDLDYIQRIAKGMGVFLSLKGHQDYCIVIDQNGDMRGTFDGTSEIQCKRLQTLLLKLLDEKPKAEQPAASGEKEKAS